MNKCIACNGTKVRSKYGSVELPCPYCNGSGKLKNKTEVISVGLRCGKLNRECIQLNLFYEGDCCE